MVPRFPSRPLCEQQQLEPIINGTYTPWRGIIFPRLDRERPISQHESALVLQAAGEDSIFEANVWGLLFYGAQIAELHDKVFGIHLYQFAGTVLMSLKHAGAMLAKLGYSGPLVIDVALSPVLEVPWLDPSAGFLSNRKGSVLDDEVRFSISTASEILDTKADRLTMDVLRYTLFAVSLPDLVLTHDLLEKLVRGGYLYNGWTRPTSLAV